MIELFSLRETLAWMSEQDPGMGLLLLGAGLIFIVYGWRMSRFMITLSLAIVAGAVGALLAPEDRVGALVVILGGVILGGWVGARTTRVAVALTAGFWAAAMALGLMARISESPNAAVIICLIAFLAVASVAFAAVRPCVAFVTSVEGTILIMTGGLILLAGVPSWWSCVRDAAESNPVFLPFAILAGTVTGYYVQLADMQEKETGLTAS